LSKRLFLLLMVFCVFAFWGQSLQAQDQKGPRAAVEGREFDFKDVKEGTVLEHTFKILNKGDETLKIVSVKPG
jgi:hypothetical protein